MNPVIIYYSLSGNNVLLAHRLQKRLGCDMFRIEDQTKRSHWAIYLDIFLGRNPKIKHPEIDLNQYDSVIFIAPIWISRVATPLMAFIKKERKRIKDYSFITFCGNGDTVQENVQPQLAKNIGIPPTSFCALGVSEIMQKKNSKSLNKVMDFRLNMKDLQQFDVRISQFLEPYEAVLV